MNTSAVPNLIRTDKMHQIPNVLQTASVQGIHTLEMSIRDLIDQGIFSMATFA